MAETVADQVFVRVEALMSEGAVASRAAAIRRVAEEMDRSVSATSSAYYSGARKLRETAAAEPAAVESAVPARQGRASGRRESAALYAEMLPLVEAGATVEQAARRFGGDEEHAGEIAAGFTRWLERQRRAAEAAPPPDDGRVAALEAEVRDLRRELDRARRAISSAREILESAGG
ncbi:MAG TPA: hypothetical protein VHK23_10070 [Miltoncostaeaceae bacterium]|jgi:hypothetical protein|nr:hypothetical protein [Miltoncostaeaceae bacterium]